MQVPVVVAWSKSAVFAGLLLGSFDAIAADPSAGKMAAAQCADCHEPKDWVGETQAALESLIRDVMQGRVKHTSKITLTDAEISSIAAYWASGSKK